MKEDVADRFFAAIDATWPAARILREGPFTLRDGQGGGKRVSAATAQAPFDEAEISKAEAGMRGLGQQPLFMIRDGEVELDQMLAGRGYDLVDPVAVMATDIKNLTDVPIPRLAAFEIWEPLAIMAEIWAKGGIGPARLDVMRRASLKTAIFARSNQKPAGTGFVAADGEIAMVHAVEVLPEHRRQGVAGWIMREAAQWAEGQGATKMAVLCTKDNTAALNLYAGLRFEPVTTYHYRQFPKTGDPKNG
ncbi:MAG: GNAT family N-acetyltransferase [Pseudomonadota bacterium]